MILAVCGPPGTGKTTIATRVHQRLESDRIEDPDAERDIHILHSDDYSRHPYERMFDQVTASDDHYILDGTFYKPAHQERYIDLPDVHFVLVRAPLDTCLRRDRERDGIGEKAVRVIHSEFHDPPVDLVLDTDILPVEDAVDILYDRTREWLE